MTQIDRLRALGLFDSRVPRYTSYPTAPVFSAEAGSAFQAESLVALAPDEPVSVYLHVPFCERLCWFCACRTQGTKTLAPVAAYVETVLHELELVRARLPEGLRMGRLHWGGGTPTILEPALIHRLAQAIKAAIPPAEDFEFSVEIDPTMVDADKIAALAQEGMNRASIGIQDFDPDVQRAIGRIQPYEVTRDCVAELRAAGIGSLNTDLVYGLPHQTFRRLIDTAQKVMDLGPDRMALFGYAHVPWVAKRQRLIDEAALADDTGRYMLSELAAALFESEGYDPIGIDHFARPTDSLAIAAEEGRLRRNFQGYTDDTCPAMIGLGASSIAKFPGGYVQNAPATRDYERLVAAGELPGARGHRLSDEDRLRGRAIEMLMCDFRLDRAALERQFGPLVATLDPVTAEVAARFGEFVRQSSRGLVILPEGRALTRIIASAYDAHMAEGARYSRAS
ncbi:oxygen-independent coproporphyrinogen III oxidase [Aquicoccus sp. SCR17]|nr:oxygen-independent coproporphyrinogen III oxidase [Carideicomes alvinocaridis]